jgi:2-polyprenyl-3-methyl-5-hydroxy-6-metoxy-1,4-benzoquinol methylase
MGATLLQDQKPKATSYAYGEDDQKQMANYYRKSKIPSESNHEYLRVVLCRELVEKWARPRLSIELTKDITVLDIACSVGTFAIEFAKQGYRSYGIDFDVAAIRIARQLNEEEGTNATFIEMDVSDWNKSVPSLDIAICFDVFEHLHDDEIGALLFALKKQLSPEGCLVFHTLPLQYDYLFWNGSKGIVEFPPLLKPFKNLSPRSFSKIVKMYSLLHDIRNVYREGLTYRESIRTSSHPNPLTQERLSDIMERAGYEILSIKTGFLGNIQVDPRDKNAFLKQPITHRSLSGVAVPKMKSLPPYNILE